MKKLLAFILIVGTFLALQGCASVNRASNKVQGNQPLTYDEIEKREEVFFKHAPSYLVKTKKHIDGNETIITNVYCADSRCEKDDKYFVFVSYVNKNNQKENYTEKQSINKEKLEGLDAFWKVLEAQLEEKREKQDIQRQKESLERESKEALKQKKLETEMAKATYAPKIRVKNSPFFSCVGFCSRTDYKEITSTDSVPFVINKTVVNNRCTLQYLSTLPMYMGESFKIPEIDLPYPAGCGKVFKLTLYTNRGVFDYDLR